MRDVSICSNEYLLLNRVDRSNSVRSLIFRPDIIFIILSIAFDASLFLKNELISERKFVFLTLSIGAVILVWSLKITHFLSITEKSYAFLYHFLQKN